MKKIADKQYKQIEELHSKVQTLYDQYNDKVNEVQDKIIDLIGEELNSTIDEFNEAVSDLQNQVEEIYGETDAFIDEKSDRWKNSDKGERYVEWSYEWNIQFTELDHVEIEVPVEDIEIYDLPSQDPNEE